MIFEYASHDLEEPVFLRDLCEAGTIKPVSACLKMSTSHTTIFDERYSPESLDVVSTFNILHLLEDLSVALARVNALLRPDEMLG